jgi:hypothetical protein
MLEKVPEKALFALIMCGGRTGAHNLRGVGSSLTYALVQSLGAGHVFSSGIL